MSDATRKLPDGRLRARGLGLPFPGKTGQNNSITDIPGVEVGYTTLIEGSGQLIVGKGPVRTGVTAILPRGKETVPHPVWAAIYTLNGAGEMTCSHWIRDYGFFFGPICLTNTHSVGITYHAATRWMREHYNQNALGIYNWAMPVVAETYDGYLNDIDGFHVRQEHVVAAIEGATSGPIAEGNVGGGTGMKTYEFKAGTGTASRVVRLQDEEFVVGALVQSNFGFRPQFTILGVPVGRHMTEHVMFTGEDYVRHGMQEAGSIIVIVGTNAPMLPLYLERMARRMAIGIGRTGTTGSDYSSDICLAFSTANPSPRTGDTSIGALTYTPSDWLDPIFTATVQSIEEAIVNAMVAAETMIGCDDHKIVAIDHDELCEIMARYNRQPLD